MQMWEKIRYQEERDNMEEKLVSKGDQYQQTWHYFPTY